MEKKINLYLDQISKILNGLKDENLDIDRLIELDKSLELLSQNIKTARLEILSKPIKDIHQNKKQDAVLFISRDFKIVRIVGAFEAFIKISTSNSLPDLDTIFDTKSFKLIKERISLVYETGEAQSFDVKLISHNDILLPANILLEKIRFSSNEELISAGFIFYGQTPSDLKEYQEILIENLPGLDVYLFDTKFRHVVAGGTEKQRLNLTNADFTGKTLFEIYNETNQKRLYPFYQNAIDGKNSEGEVRIGKQVYFISASPVFDFNNNVVGGALIVQNVTREKEVENNLKKAKKEAEYADKAKSLFMANMSHEIRTPLNSIIGFTSLLNKTVLTPKQKKYSYLINQSADHLLSVVNEVLFLFKLGMGKVYIEKIPFDIYELVRNVHDSIFFRADDKNLKFKYFIDPEVPEILIGDPFRIKQILMNLTVNAIKFTDNGFVALTVSKERITKKKIYVNFEVEDTGIGISPEDQEHIFEEFLQAEVTSGKNRKGAGLGLTITKKLVELLKGGINLESEVNKGTKFTVLIPFEMPGEKDVISQETKYDMRYNQLEGKRILYADDDENNVLLAESIFSEWKTEVEIVYNGLEAYKLISSEKFDVILLDIHMPGMAGNEVAKKVKKQKDGPNNLTKMLAVTANIMEEDIKRYLKDGFDDYILKPFTEEELYSKVCSLLDIDKKFILKKKHKNKILKRKRDSAGLDISMLLQSAGGDFFFFNKMIDTFIGNAHDTINQFQKGLKDEDWNLIGEKAHKAIPSFRYFGLGDMVNRLSKIENLALRRKQFKKIPSLVKEVISKMLEWIEKAQYAKIPDEKNN